MEIETVTDKPTPNKDLSSSHIKVPKKAKIPVVKRIRKAFAFWASP